MTHISVSQFRTPRMAREALETPSVDALASQGTPISEPKDLPLEGRKIMVDPGHGGTDIGARGPGGGHEADVNLGISLKLREKLEALGADVRMTRATDTNVGPPGGPQRDELRARVRLANAWPAEVFISVHSNSNVSPRPQGTETYHSRNASQASKDLAGAVHAHMVEQTGFRDRGVKQANFYVIKNTHMPAILVETGFMSNPQEEQKLLDPVVQDKMATAISRGVEDVFATPEPSKRSLAQGGVLLGQ